MQPLAVVLALHALGVLTQAALAGQFLSGADSAVAFHEITGWTIATLGLIQILVSIFPRRAPLWFLIASVATFLGEILQVGTGYGRFLGVHIPLSIVIFGLLIWQCAWAFRSDRP
jgi:hypothetical protein